MPINSWRAEQAISPLAGVSTNITQLANGNILVTSTTGVDSGPVAGNDIDIMGQIFDPYGNPEGPAFRVNQSFFLDSEQGETIAPMADGGFLAVYLDVEPGGARIRYDRYDASGTFTTGGTVATPVGGASLSQVRAVTSSATSTLIVYRETTGGDANVVARIFDGSTGTLGAAFTLMNPPENIGSMDAAVLANGNYVIVGGAEGADDAIAVRIVSPTGANVLGFLRLAGTTTDGSSVDDIAVTGLTNGNFVIATTEFDGTDTDVMVRVVNAAGTVLATNLVAGGGTLDDQSNEPVVAALTDGTFVVAFDDDQADEMVVQHFAADGTSLDTLVFSGGGTAPAIVALGDGRFAMSYYSDATSQAVMEIFDTRNGINAVPAYTPTRMQIGTIGDDVFTAAVNADEVNGHTGNDTITEAGIVKLYLGGAGNDRLNVTSAINSDIHHGGAGSDLIDWSASGVGGASFDLGAGTATQGAATETMIGIEDLIATGGDDILLGSAVANRLWGNEGNDQINGRDGSDTMAGGIGDDRYWVGSVGDVVVEAAGAGNDRVASTITYVLGANVERLALIGAAAISGFGNALANVMDGNAAANALNGGAGDDTMNGGNGNDTLRGQAGSDLMAGGGGDDLYVVTDIGDVVSEAGGGGTDLVQSQVSFGLSAGVENLVLGPAATALDGIGNGLDNLLRGNALGNRLWGGGGSDNMQGLGGNDVLRGGADGDFLAGGSGADRFVFFAAESTGAAPDRIVAFGGPAFEGAGVAGGDVIDLSQIDANSTLAGNQAFAFGGAGIGHLQLLEVGGVTRLVAQTDADADVEFMLIIQDGAVTAGTYTAGDFLL